MSFTLFLISCFGGFCSGLLGVGGAVVLIPLMLSIPPWVGVGSLSMHEVAGITMIQVLAASLFGCLAHHRGGNVHKRTIMAIGVPMGVCALVGSTVSKNLPGEAMLFVFGVLVLVALVLLLGKVPYDDGRGQNGFTFRWTGSILVGTSVGLAAGIVGAGGGFVVIPLMVRVLGIPMKTAIGSSLGIVFLGALMGSIGKAMTLQVEWTYLLPVVAGSIPAALAGAHVSKKLPPTAVRYLLVAVVAVVLVKTWTDLARALMG